MGSSISQGLDPPFDYQENDDVRVSSFPSLKSKSKKKALLKWPKHEKFESFIKVFFKLIFKSLSGMVT
jgi:hypothetical protein